MFFLLIIAIISVNTESSCLFDRCRCDSNSDQTVDIKCIPDLDQLNSGFPNRSYNHSNLINLFLINKYNIGKIPDEAFRHLNIKYLIIGQNNLKILSKNAFVGVGSISMLHLIESNLESIEPGSFMPLNNSLIELGFTNINVSLLNTINRELKQLKNLSTLKFNNLKLENFQSNWTHSLERLRYLSLASNRISTLQPNVFSSNIISLDLNENLINNVTNLLSSIQFGLNLKELKLKNNLISNLTTLSKLSNLEYLDLSNNKISVLSKIIFKNMTKLTHLYLSGNRLKNLDKNLFIDIKDLMVLLLNNNHLVVYPNISTLMRLKILDLSNQNGNLIKIDDYAFERNFEYVNTLTIYLNSNELSFASKSFCSRYSKENQIGSLDLSYDTLNKMDKCLFEQFKSNNSAKMIIKVESDKLNKNKTNECNCDIWEASRKFQISIFNLLECNETICNEKSLELFECDEKFKCSF